MTTVTGTGPTEMKILAAKLHAADGELKKNLRRQLRQEATPVMREVKASILSMPSHHDGTLRKEIARTVSARSSIRKTGVALDVVSAGTRMPAGKQNLNAYTDQARGWNHPVYGRQMPEKTAAAARRILGKGKGRGHGRGWTWTRQTGKPGWFEVTISKHAREFRAAAQRAIDDTKRMLS